MIDGEALSATGTQLCFLSIHNLPINIHYFMSQLPINLTQ